jgi:hypothetical protein
VILSPLQALRTVDDETLAMMLRCIATKTAVSAVLKVSETLGDEWRPKGFGSSLQGGTSGMALLRSRSLARAERKGVIMHSILYIN